jgi:hypothetical protein
MDNVNCLSRFLQWTSSPPNKNRTRAIPYMLRDDFIAKVPGFFPDIC